MRLRSTAPLVLFCTLSALGGCKKDKKDSSNPDTTTAGTGAGTGSSGGGGVQAGQVSLANVALNLDAKGVDTPAVAALTDDGLGLVTTTTDPYAGIGINSGESVVEGLKIWVTSVSLENQIDSDAANTANRTVQIFDWSAEPKELQIAKGYSATLNSKINTYLKPGEYNRMAVSMQDKMSVKAYAYLDANNDGTIDTTVYTTAAGVVKVDSLIDATALPADYDYYTYGYIGALTADSVTASTKTAGTLTVFDKPVVIPETDIDARVAAGEKPDDSVTPPVNLAISLVVDTTYLMKVWNGKFGDEVTTPYIRGNGKIPQPEFPFPMDAIEAHGRRHDVGLTQLDFYPVDKPAFGIGNYIPMFAFANVAKAGFQVYAFSLDQNYDVFWAPNQVGAYKKTLILTLAVDGDGKPLLSRTTSLAESLELFIGAVGRIFELQPDGTYTFYTNYGVKDANGKDDGGLYYHSDKTMAGHSFEGFKMVDVGEEFQVTQKDGPRCNAEYNYCVGAAGKTLYVKRLK